MDYIEAATGLAGRSRLEGAEARNVTNAHAVRGVAMGNSEDGHVLVDLGGDVTTGDGSQWVEVATDAHVREGDLVDVLLVGESGRAMTPIVYGVPGGGDRMAASIAEKIDAVDVEYADSTSETVAPTEGWGTDAPAWQEGHYIWQRTATYSGGGVSYSDPVCISGRDGQDGAVGPQGPQGPQGEAGPQGLQGIQGETGATGPQGSTGPQGVGVSAIVEQYYLSDSDSSQTGGSWSSAQPEWAEGTFIWTRSQVTWTNGDVTTTAPVLARAINGANEAASYATGQAEAAGAAADVAQEAAEAAQAGLNDLAEEVRDDYVLLETFNQVSGVIGELVSRLQYGTNQATGDPFIRILADPSRPNGISLYLTNDRISFYDSDGREVAYISGDQLYINQGKFASDQNVGDWHWRQRGNDHLTLTYQGGD